MLAGRSKVLLVVNVSPTRLSLQETQCSLRFATRCRDVKLGQAQRSHQPATSPPAGASAAVGGGGLAFEEADDVVDDYEPGPGADGGGGAAGAAPRR